MGSKKRYILAMVLSSLCIATIGIFVKMIGNTMPVATLSFFRMLFATLFLAAIAPLFDKETFSVNTYDLRRYAIIGFIFMLNIVTYHWAFLEAPVSTVVLLVSVYVVFTAFFAAKTLNERITKTHVASIAIAFLGLLLMNPLSPSSMKGSIIAIVSAVFFAMFSVGVRHVEKDHGVGTTFWFILFTTLFLSPAPFLYGIGNVGGNIVWLILLGCLSTGVAYLLFSYAYEKLEAEEGAIISVVSVPVFAIFFAILIFAEQLTWNMLLGGFLLILSGILVEYTSLMKPKEE